MKEKKGKAEMHIEIDIWDDSTVSPNDPETLKAALMAIESAILAGSDDIDRAYEEILMITEAVAFDRTEWVEEQSTTRD